MNNQSNRKLPFQFKVLVWFAYVTILVTPVALPGCDNSAGSTGSEVEGIKVYFSPDDQCDEKIVGLINDAKHSLHIAIYSFNRKPISDAVIAAHKRNIEVRVVFDESQTSGPNSRDRELEENGVTVRRDNYPGTGVMHNKFAVIDNRIVITGSYNWTTNATTNSKENLIVITSQNIAKIYNDEFEIIWKHAP